MSLLTHMKSIDLDVERKEHGWGLEKQQSPEKKGNKRNQETWEGAGMEYGAAGQADSCPCLIGHRQLRSPR